MTTFWREGGDRIGHFVTRTEWDRTSPDLEFLKSRKRTVAIPPRRVTKKEIKLSEKKTAEIKRISNGVNSYANKWVQMFFKNALKMEIISHDQIVNVMEIYTILRDSNCIKNINFESLEDALLGFIPKGYRGFVGKDFLQKNAWRNEKNIKLLWDHL